MLKPSLQLKLGQTLTMTPQLQQAIRLLQLPALELQAHIRELLEIFFAEGVNSAFVCTFVQYQLPHRSSPREDLDMGSYSIVKVYEDRFGETYPDMAWEPKAAFTVLASYYHTHATR